ncbi:8-oxo-dGTP diphosphatase [Cohnella sp. SGD-V74]|uniref:NUDIX hydrolase n=1 Tax=unclassified Cohnella TaxID=2636738 RepID=UPI000D45F8D1|nr:MULTISPECIES: 8-oxo-dGTP diphosphatase [unclassified Cohnella]PRX72610.1 8-oxo-dGTP diphosphatase [Cohnella sp. SGD-V74]
MADIIIKYNICFVRRGDEILLLNREFAPWMGSWNGVGGKLEKGEEPREAMIREIAEETNIECDQYRLHYKGMITWNDDDTSFGGMYLYVAEVPASFSYSTPLQTDEGILQWKTVGWIMDGNNGGVVSNIPRFLETALNDPECYEHHCYYRNDELVTLSSNRIDPLTETDRPLRETYLRDKHRGVLAIGK